jgi:hypothetical protein
MLSHVPATLPLKEDIPRCALESSLDGFEVTRLQVAQINMPALCRKRKSGMAVFATLRLATTWSRVVLEKLTVPRPVKKVSLS